MNNNFQNVCHNKSSTEALSHIFATLGLF